MSPSSSPTGPTRDIQIVFWSGFVGVLLGVAGIQFATDPGWVRLFDNLHRTSGIAAAAGMAWLGWREACREGRSGPQGWFALGLIGYAIGQVTWDIQTWYGFSRFPAPSDLFYLSLGPSLICGLLLQVRAGRRHLDGTAMALDTLALGIASLALVLALYLPRRGDLDGLAMAVLVAYPFTLLVASSTLFLMIPALRLRPTLSLLALLGGLAVTAWCGMTWNLMVLAGTTIDGAWFNVTLSLAILVVGVSAAVWKQEQSYTRRWDRRCEGFLRLLPLFEVILASGATIAVNYSTGTPEVVRRLILVAALAVIGLAAIRQGRMLRDRDHLRTTLEENRRHEQALRQERGLLRGLFAAMPDLIWAKDPAGVYLACNPAFERLYGVREEEIIGHTDYDFIDKALADASRRHDWRAIEAGRPSVHEEWLTFASDGHRGLFETMKTPLRDAEGRLLGVLGVARDITERIEQQRRLRTATADLGATLRAIPDLLFELDPAGVYLNLWAQDEGLLPMARERMLGHPVIEVLPADAARVVIDALRKATAQGYSRGQQIRLELSCGPHWFELSTARKQAVEGQANFIQLARDITRLKEQEEQLRRIAFYDPLTGIPNRRLLVDRMGQAVAQARREGRILAVCYLDLDGFKPINDTLGHEAGDQVLIHIARRIGQIIRAGDTVARLGGDEFVVLLVGLHRREECVASLDRLLDGIRQPLDLNGRFASIGASIGVTLFPADDVDPDTLLRHADQAMYAAKQSGKDRYRFYEGP